MVIADSWLTTNDFLSGLDLFNGFDGSSSSAEMFVAPLIVERDRGGISKFSSSLRFLCFPAKGESKSSVETSPKIVSDGSFGAAAFGGGGAVP